MRELRFAYRRLMKSPLQLAAGLLAFALGIGINTAMFSVGDALLYHPLELPGIDRLTIFNVFVRGSLEGIDSITAADFFEFKAGARSFSSLAAMMYWDATITRDAEPEQLRAAQVSAGWLETFESPIVRGRSFAAGEDEPGKNRVIVVSEGLWMRRYGSDPKIIGRKIVLNGSDYEVVGVVKQTSRYPTFIDVFAPLPRNLAFEEQRDAFQMKVVGRLAPGVGFESAQAEVATLQAGIVSRHPKTHSGRSLQLVPLSERIAGSNDLGARFVRMLGLAAAFVLMIACANVANLQLARVTGRAREFAILSALGAGRWPIARQVLLESLILSGGGALIGIVASVWCVDLLKNLLPVEIWQYIPMWPTVHVNGYALALTASMAVVAGVLSGLGPAYNSTRTDALESLRDGGRAMTSGARRQWFRASLVAFQMTLAMVLLIGAGLMVRGAQSLFHSFENKQPQQVATMRTLLAVGKYDTAAKRIEFGRRLEEEIHRIPGAKSVALANYIPLSDNGSSVPIVVEGRMEPTVADRMSALDQIVSPSYFGLMRIALRKGRFLEEGDGSAREAVCVVDETFANAAFPNEDPIGHRISPSFDQERNYCRIVGVAGAELHYAWEKAPRKTFYRPAAQVSTRSLSLLVRSDGDARQLLVAARRAVFAVDPDQPVLQAFTYEELIGNTLAGLKMIMILMSGIGIVALLLACLGVYSVMSYTVSERTNEIGMRMAMGAQTADVLLLVGKQALSMCGSGMLLGLTIGYGLAQLFSGLIFGVSANDFWSLSSVLILLGAVAALAMYLPARRAIAMDPADALRHD